VVIPPNSIGPALLVGGRVRQKLIELSESGFTAQSPMELTLSVVVDGNPARSSSPRL